MEPRESSDERYTPLFRLRERLETIGIDTGFWLNRERATIAEPADEDDSSLDTPESIRELHREFASTLAEREWDEVNEAFRKNPQPFPCQVLVLTGDLLAERGRAGDTLEAYGLAIDLAPTPQGQLEVGYLLGLRGRPQSPYFSLGHEPLILRPHDELGFEGLQSYQVIYGGLLPKPGFDYPEPSRLLRLALEAYGRVYAYYVDEAVGAGSDQPASEQDLWTQPLVLDGIGTLMDALGEEGAFELVWNASGSWCEVLHDGLPLFIEDRLALWKAHVDGERLGRDKERQLFEAIRQLDQERQSTQVFRDPDKLVEKLEEAVARLGSVPKTTRAEIERDWASLVGTAWRNLFDAVRVSLIEGEWLKGVIEREDGSDYGAMALYYGKAIEAMLCETTHSRTLLHQFVKMMGARDPGLVKVFRTGAPLDKLASMLDKIARARNQAAHSTGDGYRRTDLGTIRELRELIGGSAKNEGLVSMLANWRDAR